MNECGSIVVLSNLTIKGFDLVAKNFKEQSKINKVFAVFSVLASVHILTLHKKIERLSDEVKELKHPMGE